MKTGRIHGESDQILIVDGDLIQKRYTAYTYTSPYACAFKLISGNEGIEIHAIYDGSWAFAVTSENRDDDWSVMPNWPVSRAFGGIIPYSETITVEVPDDTVFTFHKR